MISVLNRAVLFCILTLLVACDASVDSPASITESYLHGRAAWSPDGKSIAFSSLIENQVGIYITDTLGTSIRQIVQGEGVGASWSPDGRWIAFSRNGSLYKVKPDGDSLKQLTDQVGAVRPSWSRNGSRIAFVIRNSAGAPATWLYDVSSGASSLLLSRGDFPSWHPTTGELVLLDAQYDAVTGYISYAFLAVTISDASVRTFATFSSAADCGFCSISPKGTDIAFGLLSPVDYAQIWVYNIAQNHHSRITTEGGDYPAWSPDGSRIVYTRTQQGDGGLWIMNPDGTGGRRLTKAQ